LVVSPSGAKAVASQIDHDFLPQYNSRDQDQASHNHNSCDTKSKREGGCSLFLNTKQKALKISAFVYSSKAESNSYFTQYFFLLIADNNILSNDQNPIA